MNLKFWEKNKEVSTDSTSTKPKKVKDKDKYRSYDEARKYAQALGLENKGPAYYFELAKQEGWPEDMPMFPNQVYKKNWMGWEEYLTPVWNGGYGNYNRY